MNLIFLDTINTILQSLIISFLPYSFLVNSKLINKKEGYAKLIISSISIIASVCICTKVLNSNNLSLLTISILNMIIIGVVYKDCYKKALLAYFIAYFFLQSAVILFSSITWPIAKDIFSDENISKIIGMYIPIIVCEFLLLFNSKKIYSVYNFFERYKYSFEISFLLIFSLDYIICLSIGLHSWANTILANVTIFTFIIFVAVAIIYIKGINSKYEEIERLNNLLIEKNNELRKIKHDYGSQISYINGLYIMNQYDRLGELLQKIINGNNSVSTHIKCISNKDSIITDIFNSLDVKDVHVIIDEEVDLKLLEISEYDLHKIISNIINNSLTALNHEGLIVIKTYKIFNSTYISIKNNGPQIDPDIITKIFELGFTTKKDYEKNHGYGLYIVKETVENNNGKIYVESNEEYTEFKIIFSK
ncbi:sensor histidine kinase [[Clostridium] sordellii]|uniref:sensor histidine kinase n=1 Tax=Paraclostridium sordellii TaxID=1505 RepID=UPI0005DBA8FE|nr:ATP-binding protein [Paeniclostridium sordellii]CEO06734.1 sensor histidine kinase [[Clostridium] sordellii] [Paeniclostridium sordellii]